VTLFLISSPSPHSLPSYLRERPRVHHEIKQFSALREVEGEEDHVPGPSLLAGVGGGHVVVEERQDVGVGVQGLHGSDFRAEHLQNATRGGLLVDDFEGHVLAAVRIGKRKGGREGEYMYLNESRH